MLFSIYKRFFRTRQYILTRSNCNISFLISILFVAIFILSPSNSDGLNEYSISLSARPDVITADTSSYTTISAEVKKEDGNSAPDGTVVEFSTNLGRIENRVTTVNGIARARFQSEITSGMAMITAAVSGSRGVATINVDVLPQGTKLESTASITIESKEMLLYDPERKLVDGIGGVTINIGKLQLSGYSALFDIGRKSIRIKSGGREKDIKIKKDKIEITGSEAIIDLNKMTAIYFGSSEEGAKRNYISLRDLKDRDEKDARAIAAPAEPVSGVILIGADKIIIKMGKEVKLINAVFFLEGDKTIKMPYYKMSLKSGGASRSFTYGSEGLRADIPIYLGLDETSSTAVKIRRQEQSGWGYYGGSKRWETDLVKEYDQDNGASGSVIVKRVGSSDWGLNWSGRNEFDDGIETYTYIDTPSHQNVYGNFDINKTADTYSASFSFRGAKVSNGRSYTYSGINYQMKPIKIGSPLFTYSLSGRGFYDSNYKAVNQHLGGAGGLQLYCGPFDIIGGISLNTQGSIKKTWGGSTPGTDAYSNASLSKDISNNARINVNYNYSWNNTDTEEITYDTLSSDLYLTLIPGLITNFSIIKGLRQGTTSSFSNFTYTLSKEWYLKGISTWQKYTGYSYTDYQIGVVRTLGNQEARLFYSKSRDRFLFEFSAAGL